jgi:nucleoside 2-deoxyribosyltransferase
MQEVFEVLKQLEDGGHIDLFAPFYDGMVLRKEDPDLRKKMRLVWWLDIEKVKQSALVVACTQDHDVGTIFECGYASANGKTILCYNSNPEFGLNVMLAQEAKGFIKTKEQLKLAIESFIKAYSEGQETTWVWNIWSGEPI